MAAKGRRKLRLKELSSDLGLSITTVSRALAGYSDVSAATRERVREAAERSGYIPSRAGRMLVSGNSGFVGLVVPLRDSHFIDAFLGEFIVGLSQALTEGGRDLAISTATGKRSEVDVLRHVVNGQQVDGVVVNRALMRDARVSYLIDQQIPFVLHGRVPDETRPYVWFDTDGTAAFSEATEMLIDLGHRHFGLLTFSESFTFTHFRRAGLESALKRHGLSLPSEAVASVGRFDEDELARASAALLSLRPRPTAILCATDALAIKLVEVAGSLSINVPSDLSVIGFDNVPVSAYATPGITTFDQRIQESAVNVANMLVQVIDGDVDAVKPRLVKADFIARGSHGPAPAVQRPARAAG
ncbi:MAG: LacI family DNA-binding transcriptional regulator [Pseudomonadota bacterium]